MFRKSRLIIIFSLLMLCRLSFGQDKIPEQYIGNWIGSDGTRISIRADATGDFLGLNTSLKNGNVFLNQTKKVLQISSGAIEKTWKINSPPQNTQMRLGKIVFRKVNEFEGLPPELTMRLLVDETLSDFDAACRNSDITEFYRKISNGWREQISVQELYQAFSAFIEKKIYVNDYIKGANFSFTSIPRIDIVKANKLLKLAGKYETKPLPVKFELEYVREDAGWKLFRFKVSTKQD